MVAILIQYPKPSLAITPAANRSEPFQPAASFHETQWKLYFQCNIAQTTFYLLKRNLRTKVVVFGLADIEDVFFPMTGNQSHRAVKRFERRCRRWTTLTLMQCVSASSRRTPLNTCCVDTRLVAAHKPRPWRAVLAKRGHALNIPMCCVILPSRIWNVHELARWSDGGRGLIRPGFTYLSVQSDKV